MWVTWLASAQPRLRRTWNSHVHSPPPALSYTLFKHALLDFALRHHPQRAPVAGTSGPRAGVSIGNVSPSKRVSAALRAADAHVSLGGDASASTAAAGTREKLEIRKLFLLSVEALLPAPPAQSTTAARISNNFSTGLATPPRPPLETQQIQRMQHIQRTPQMKHSQWTPQMHEVEQAQPTQHLQQMQHLQQAQNMQQVQQAQNMQQVQVQQVPHMPRTLPATTNSDPTFRHAIDDLASKLNALKADMAANPFFTNRTKNIITMLCRNKVPHGTSTF